MTNVIKLQTEEVSFDDWWSLQVHKIGKVICQSKWNAITSEQGYHTKMLDKSTGEYVDIHLKATPQEIYDGQKRQNAELFRSQNSQDEKQFIRRPQQWLNQGGWLDG
jgi:hypothetical protein